MFERRMARVRESMEQHGCDVLVLSVGADLPWLIGYEAMALERPTLLVLHRDEAPTLLVPTLEAARVRERPGLFELRPWGETEDPIALAAGLCHGVQRLAVGDQMWSRFLVDLLAHLPSVQLRRASDVLGSLRACKDSSEMDALRAAGRCVDAVIEQIQRGEIPLVGHSEAEVAADVARRLLEAGHHRVNFTIVASGPNAASPHHEAGDRVIEPDELVLFDIGGTVLDAEGVGYCSDTTRCVLTGEAPTQVVEAYEVLRDAQRMAVTAATIGTPAEDVDDAARSLIAAAGYGEQFVHRTGHGIGVEAHEDPYLVEGNLAPLVLGNAFSIEPGIYVSGRFGMRLEDIVLATNDGPEPVNRTDHSLVTIAS